MSQRYRLPRVIRPRDPVAIAHLIVMTFWVYASWAAHFNPIVPTPQSQLKLEAIHGHYYWLGMWTAVWLARLVLTAWPWAGARRLVNFACVFVWTYTGSLLTDGWVVSYRMGYCAALVALSMWLLTREHPEKRRKGDLALLSRQGQPYA